MRKSLELKSTTMKTIIISISTLLLIAFFIQKTTDDCVYIELSEEKKMILLALESKDMSKVKSICTQGGFEYLMLWSDSLRDKNMLKTVVRDIKRYDFCKVGENLFKIEHFVNHRTTNAIFFKFVGKTLHLSKYAASK